MSASAPSTAINLRRLLLLRGFTLLGLLLTLVFAVERLGMVLPVAPIIAVLGALSLVSFATLWRLRRSWPVRDAELFAQLLIDVAALTAVFYLSGGSTNPLVTLYLLPLAIAAATLPAGYVWAMAAVATLCYSVLLGWHQPLTHAEHDHDGAFGAHVFGMWVGFVIAAWLIAGFAVRMNGTLRERERALAALREAALRNERVVALGALAAGAAHELGTPLATAAVLARELDADVSTDAARERLALLREQVRRCKGILSGLAAAAGGSRAEAAHGERFDRYLAQLVAGWRASRPAAQVATAWQGTGEAPRIVVEQTISQAILNLLNNAADASPGSVSIRGEWRTTELTIEVADRGPGLPAGARLGEAGFSTKQGEGLGLGLFLVQSVAHRFGGQFIIANREGGGALARLELPLAALHLVETKP